MAPLSAGCAFGAANVRVGYFPPPKEGSFVGDAQRQKKANVELKLIQLVYGMAAGRTSVGLTSDGQWIAGAPAWFQGAQPRQMSFHLTSPAPYLAARRSLVSTEPLPEGITPTISALLAAFLPPLIGQLKAASPEFSVTSLTFTAPLPALVHWRAVLADACDALDVTLQDVITETEAILAAYHYTRAQREGAFAPGDYLVICDWGAEAVQLALVRAGVPSEEEAPFELLAYHSLTGISGRAIDRFLWPGLRHRYLDHHRDTVAFRGSVMQQISEEIEAAKMALSNMRTDDEPAFLSHLSELAGQEATLSHKDFTHLLETLCTAPFIEACTLLHRSAGEPPIAHLLLAGGGSALPNCLPALQHLFPAAAVTSPYDFEPEEAPVFGAILRAAQHHGRTDAGSVVTLAVPPLLPYEIAIASGPPRARRFLPVIAAHTPMTAAMNGERIVRVRGAGELSLTIVCHRADDPYRRLPPQIVPLARVNLGALPADTPVSVRVTGAPGAFWLFLTWPGGRVGPLPLAEFDEGGLRGDPL